MNDSDTLTEPATRRRPGRPTMHQDGSRETITVRLNPSNYKWFITSVPKGTYGSFFDSLVTQHRQALMAQVNTQQTVAGPTM